MLVISHGADGRLSNNLDEVPDGIECNADSVGAEVRALLEDANWYG